MSSRNGILNIVAERKRLIDDTTVFFTMVPWLKKGHGKDHSVVILTERFSRKVLGHLNLPWIYWKTPHIFRCSSPWSHLLGSESKAYSYVSLIPDPVGDLKLLCNVIYRYPVPITLTSLITHVLIIWSYKLWVRVVLLFRIMRKVSNVLFTHLEFIILIL